MYSKWLFESISVASGVIIVDGQRRVTADDARGMIARIQDYLINSGITPGMRVALFPERSADWILLLQALLLIRAVPTLIDKNLDPRSILTDESYIITNTNNNPSKGLKHLSLTDIIDEAFRCNTGDCRLLCNEGDSAEDSVLVVHTSGTTGKPKKVHYSYKNLRWALCKYYNIYKLDENTRILFSLPFHYCYSVIPCCLTPIMFGKTIIVLPEGGSNDEVFRLIGDESVEVIVATPSLYKDMTKLNMGKVDFRSLKVCDSGGESMSPLVARFLEDVSSVIITEGYGLSETTSLTHFLIPNNHGNIKYGSVGPPLGDVICSIVDNDGNELKSKVIGELCIQGPMVARYEDRSILSDDNKFHTGDYFYEDDGYYYFVGRKKEMVGISPDIAAAIHAQIPGLVLIEEVTDVAYIMYSDDDIEILYSSDSPASSSYDQENSMRRLLSEEIQHVSFRRVSGIPRNTNGKVIIEKAKRKCAE